MRHNIPFALDWARGAAAHDQASAYVLLGHAHMKGAGVRQSSEEALYWYTKAADKGSAQGL